MRAEDGAEQGAAERARGRPRLGGYLVSACDANPADAVLATPRSPSRLGEATSGVWIPPPIAPSATALHQRQHMCHSAPPKATQHFSPRCEARVVWGHLGVRPLACWGAQPPAAPRLGRPQKAIPPPRRRPRRAARRARRGAAQPPQRRRTYVRTRGAPLPLCCARHAARRASTALRVRFHTPLRTQRARFLGGIQRPANASNTKGRPRQGLGSTPRALGSGRAPTPRPPHESLYLYCCAQPRAALCASACLRAHE